MQITVDDLDEPLGAQTWGDEVERSNLDLVTVGRFWNPVDANVLRGCLEANGVDAYVVGEHLGTGYNFLSVASGGTRVQVPADQLVRAQEILAALERGDLAIDEAPE